jgi:hypothetical protein
MGDFFIGNEKNQGYMDDKPTWFDYCDVNWLSVVAVNDSVEELGYEGGDRAKLYWCLHGKKLGDSGALRLLMGLEILQDHDPSQMIRSLFIYVLPCCLLFEPCLLGQEMKKTN